MGGLLRRGRRQARRRPGRAARAVTAREADDLVREAAAFLALVEGLLGLDPALLDPALLDPALASSTPPTPVDRPRRAG